MKRSLLLCCFLPVFAIGFAIGRWTASESESGALGEPGDPDQIASGPTRPGDSSPERTRTMALSDRSLAGHPHADSVALDEVRLPVAALEAVARSGGIKLPDQNLFSSDDAVEEALGITDQEKSKMQKHWRGAMQKIRDAEVASANFVERPDGSVSFIVDPLPGLRDTQRRELSEAAAAELGPDRGAALMALKGGDELMASGEEAVAFSVNVEEAGAGRWRFRIEETRGDQRKVWIADAIPEELQHLTDAAGVVRRVNDPTTEGDNE